MTRIRGSKLSEGALLLALLGLASLPGCDRGASGGRPAYGPAGAASGDAPPRRPDAVVLEPAPALPRPSVRADARGVVSLREPPGATRVTDVVESFVAAWQSGSIDALVALLAPDAGPIDARARGRAGLVEGWRQRMRAHDYARLAGVELVRPESIERWDRDDLGGPGAPPPVPDMLPGDVYVRVPLEVTTFAGEKLFGDVLVMILRPDEGKLRIAAYGEVDR